MKKKQKNILSISTAGLVLALVFGGLGYYIANNQYSTNQSVLPSASQSVSTERPVISSPTPKSTRVSNVFDVTTAKVGDKVAGMTITAIGPWSEELYEETLPYNAKVQFTGQETISGTITSIDPFNSPLGGYEMKVDPVFSSIIPRIASASRRSDGSYLHLRGNLVGKEFVGPYGSEWRATIVIDDYLIEQAETEVSDSADLIKVVSKTRI
ncbi:MAG: hypothetical protein WD200_01490 [Candidatus Andersenbacteria bacterium]